MPIKLFSLSQNNTGISGATFDQISTLIWLLLAVVLVAIISKYIKLPYTIVLVLAGVLIALVPGIPQIALTPDLIVLVFLPVLLFEAAYHLTFEHLKADFPFISSLAILGVLATAGLVAGFMIVVAGLSWQTSLLLGAMIAATDPVSVVATFRHLGTSKRLTSIIESESLFNDGSALVIFNLLLGIVVAQEFSVWGSLLEFVKVGVGGILLGTITGYVALFVLKRMDDYLTEILITLLAAYGTFMIGEEVGVSPALAVVVTGLLVGNIGQSRTFSPTTQLALNYTWDFFGFVANSLIFLLVGLQVRLISFTNYWIVTALAIVATVLGRWLVVGLFSGITNLWQRKMAIPWSWQVMLSWGGLRGALSLAMALSLPLVLNDGTSFPDHDGLLVMTFGVIMFSLIVQGLSIEPVMKLLKLNEPTSEQVYQYDVLKLEIHTLEKLKQHLQTLHEALLDTTIQSLLNDYQNKIEECQAKLKGLRASDSVEALQTGLIQEAKKQLLESEKIKFNSLHAQGLIGEKSLHELQTMLNAELKKTEEVDPTLNSVRH